MLKNIIMPVRGSNTNGVNERMNDIKGLMTEYFPELPLVSDEGSGYERVMIFRTKYAQTRNLIFQSPSSTYVFLGITSLDGITRLSYQNSFSVANNVFCTLVQRKNCKFLHILGSNVRSHFGWVDAGENDGVFLTNIMYSNISDERVLGLYRSPFTLPTEGGYLLMPAYAQESAASIKKNPLNGIYALGDTASYNRGAVVLMNNERYFVDAISGNANYETTVSHLIKIDD